jgi:hypothetical protein
MIFWRKIVIFHTKYPNKFRASLRSAQFFRVRPPPNFKSWIRPWVQPVHRSGGSESQRPHSISHRRFILIFPLFCWYFQLFNWLCFVTALYKVYAIWIFCCTGNKAILKVYQWFYWTSVSQFWEMSRPVHGTPKQSCSACKISLGGPVTVHSWRF